MNSLSLRRELCLSAAAMLLAPTLGRAARPRRIGVLRSETATMSAMPLLEALAELGYKVGENLEIETRIAAPSPQAFQQSADELVRLNVEVLVAISTPAVLAAMKATTSIPIVMIGSSAPIEQGLAGTLARPGGNLTGVVTVPDDAFYGKQLALLKEAAPKVTRIAVVLDPAFQSRWPRIVSASQTLGVGVFAAQASSFEQLAAHLRQERAEAVVVFPSVQINAYEQRLAEFALAHRLPTMFGTQSSIKAGGLMSYWTRWADLGRGAALLVDKILKGRKPADLPIEQPSRFDLLLNLRTAKALDLAIPRSLLLQATEITQ